MTFAIMFIALAGVFILAIGFYVIPYWYGARAVFYKMIQPQADEIEMTQDEIILASFNKTDGVNEILTLPEETVRTNKVVEDISESMDISDRGESTQNYEVEKGKTSSVNEEGSTSEEKESGFVIYTAESEVEE